jgi:hypothetical protein
MAYYFYDRLYLTGPLDKYELFDLGFRYKFLIQDILDLAMRHENRMCKTAMHILQLRIFP